MIKLTDNTYAPSPCRESARTGTVKTSDNNNQKFTESHDERGFITKWKAYIYNTKDNNNDMCVYSARLILSLYLVISELGFLITCTVAGSGEVI